MIRKPWKIRLLSGRKKTSTAVPITNQVHLSINYIEANCLARVGQYVSLSQKLFYS